MSRLETPMTEEYWKQVGGTLIEEFLAVKRTPTNGQRLIDAVIIKNGENRRVKRGEKISLEGKDIICVQTEARRLGMYLMGQAIFSPKLLKKFKPKSIKSVALVNKNDSVLGPMLEQFPNLEVVVMPTKKR